MDRAIKRKLLRVECSLFPDRRYLVERPWTFHEQNYLSTPQDSPETFAALHADMRKHGIDWFKPHQTVGKYRGPHSDISKQRISTSMKASNKIWHRGTKQPQLYYWRNRKDKPRMKEWAITTQDNFYIVTNLAAWCRAHHVPYSVIKGKVRFNSWPYIPRVDLNIQSIRRYSK